jgi:cyclic beta-1,2-glucan synthetase
MYRIILENVLGVKRRGKTLSISPCIPSSWGSFEVAYRFGASKYQIFVENPLNVSCGVVRLEVDGLPSVDGYVRLNDDGQLHEVRVTLGHGELAVPASGRSARRSSR